MWSCLQALHIWLAEGGVKLTIIQFADRHFSLHGIFCLKNTEVFLVKNLHKINLILSEETFTN